MRSENEAAGVPEQGCAPRGRRSGDPPEVQGVWSESSRAGAGAGARRPRRGPGEGSCSAGARARRAPQPALPSAWSTEPAPSRAFPRRSGHMPSATPSRRVRRTQAPTRPHPKFQASGAVCKGSPRGLQVERRFWSARPAGGDGAGPGGRDTSTTLLRRARLPLPRLRGTRGLQRLRAGRGMPGRGSVCEACSWPLSTRGWEAAAEPGSAGSCAATREGAGLPLRSPVPRPRGSASRAGSPRRSSRRAAARALTATAPLPRPPSATPSGHAHSAPRAPPLRPPRRRSPANGEPSREGWAGPSLGHAPPRSRGRRCAPPSCQLQWSSCALWRGRGAERSEVIGCFRGIPEGPHSPIGFCPAFAGLRETETPPSTAHLRLAPLGVSVSPGRARRPGRSGRRCPSLGDPVTSQHRLRIARLLVDRDVLRSHQPR